MDPTKKKQIFMVAGLVVAAIAVFLVVFFVFPKSSKTTEGTPVAANPDGGQPASPGGPPPAAMPDTSAPGGAQPAPPMPSAAPPMSAMPAPEMSAPPTPRPAMTGALVDPFTGGPYTPKVTITRRYVPPPPDIHLSYLPPASPSIRKVPNPPPKMPTVKVTPQPPGRHAGWIYSTNGNVSAIFVDKDGKAHAVRVGDQVDNLTVKAIAPEAIVMVDRGGTEFTFRLQSEDTMPVQPPRTDVTPTPGMPPWGGK